MVVLGVVDKASMDCVVVDDSVGATNESGTSAGSFAFRAATATPTASKVMRSTAAIANDLNLRMTKPYRSILKAMNCVDCKRVKQNRLARSAIACGACQAMSVLFCDEQILVRFEL